MESILDNPLVRQYGGLGLALVVMAVLVVTMIWVGRWIFTKGLPQLNATWSAQISAEREAHERQKEADRQMFREITAAQMAASKEIHEERMRTTEAQHEEARGWHGEIITRLDKIDDKLPPFKESSP